MSLGSMVHEDRCSISSGIKSIILCSSTDSTDVRRSGGLVVKRVLFAFYLYMTSIVRCSSREFYGFGVNASRTFVRSDWLMMFYNVVSNERGREMEDSFLGRSKSRGRESR